MKEKTFEELIQESKIFQDKNGYYFIQTNTALKLMQQVREATIAEVTQIAKEDFGIGSGRPFIKHINNLQKDRILTDK